MYEIMPFYLSISKKIRLLSQVVHDKFSKCVSGMQVEFIKRLGTAALEHCDNYSIFLSGVYLGLQFSINFRL